MTIDDIILILKNKNNYLNEMKLSAFNKGDLEMVSKIETDIVRHQMTIDELKSIQ